KRIAGLPQAVLHGAREAAQAEGKDGWTFTLHAPSYLPVMQYADDRRLRETMYRESVTRASEFGRPEWDNTPLIARIVALRRELAQLLGYGSYAEVSLVPKMAESPGQVLRFLDDLARRARPFAERDVEELRDSAGTASNPVIGQFYTDLYARDTKRGGAWMDDAITRRRRGGQLQTPVAYLNCNFSRPVGGKPALFTHDDVLTLFHEFGHGLHHLLTRIDDLGVSGLNGVEWDAVELPSQFMENFCWEWDVLRNMARHAGSGAPLPRELFDKMVAAKNFHSGLAMLRQIEFAVFDMRLHSDFDPASGQTPLALLQEVRARVAVLHPPGYNRFPNNFSHIFAGGYAAGYYSYKWAEVLSADAYSFFEENGVLDARSGQRFRDEILAVGGSRPAAESFRAFRGREPRVEALLKHNGMISA